MILLLYEIYYTKASIAYSFQFKINNGKYTQQVGASSKRFEIFIKQLISVNNGNLYTKQRSKIVPNTW